MYAKKSLGQNFLMHSATAERIALAAGLPAEATVLEIGPGTGQLTRSLLKSASKVIAVEADHSLIPVLSIAFPEEIRSGKLSLIEADIRSFDTDTLPKGYHLVANIPYYITGEIIRQFLTAKNQPASMTLLVQKEVAERIVRAKKESLLSLSVKAYGTPLYRFTVPRGAFLPAPSVDSAVLHIGGISREAFASFAEEERFFTVIHAGFAHKRKQLGKNLEEIWPREEVGDALSAAKIEGRVRSEDLSLQAWLTLTRNLS